MILHYLQLIIFLWVGEKSRITDRKIRPHQKEALEKAHEYFKTNDRGKLIMACGTGKTFNVLRIAENEANEKVQYYFLCLQYYF